MAFGVKIKSVTFQNEYTIETLYEAIKDKTFSAGTPSLTKHGLGTIITFPALDRNNQVWVMKAGFGGADKPSNKFSIQKNEEAGVENMAKNMALGAITNGWANIKGTFGSTAKQAEQQVVDTAKELEALGL